MKNVDWDNEEQVANQWFKWTVEFEVCGTVVADGFNMDDEGAKNMIEEHLSFTFGAETKARVLSKPDAHLIRKCQGYAE